MQVIFHKFRIFIWRTDVDTEGLVVKRLHFIDDISQELNQRK